MSETRRNELFRSMAVKTVMGVACIVAGAFVVYLAVQMVAIFGEGMGVDDRSRRLYANAHIAVHVAGTISALLIATFWAMGHRSLACIAFVVMLLCGGYGVLNMIGFTSTNRLAVSEHKTGLNKATERQYQDARKAKQNEIDWLRNTIIHEESRVEKRRLEASLAKKQKELETMQPPKPTVDTVLADPQATHFERLVGWTAENWQLVLPIPVAFLLYLAEAALFVFAAYLLIGAITDARSFASIPASPRDDEDDDAASGGSGGGKKRIKLAYDADDAARKPAAKSAMSSASLEHTTQRSAPDASVPAVPVKMPEGELKAYLRSHASGMSQRQIAAATGWSQPSVCRKSRQVRRQEERVARKAARASNEATAMNGYPGFGGRMHSPASI